MYPFFEKKSFHKKLFKIFCQLIKMLNEATDSSASVKGEATWDPFGLSMTQVKKNKIQHF